MYTAPVKKQVHSPRIEAGAISAIYTGLEVLAYGTTRGTLLEDEPDNWSLSHPQTCHKTPSIDRRKASAGAASHEDGEGALIEAAGPMPGTADRQRKSQRLVRIARHGSATTAQPAPSRGGEESDLTPALDLPRRDADALCGASTR